MRSVTKQLNLLVNAPSILAIKSGLVMLIPVLMIGSATLVFKYFPITAYQSFVENAAGGKIFEFFDFIYNATFGMFSVYLTFAVSYCYSKSIELFENSFSAPITSFICFSILSGVKIGDASWDALGVKGAFVAIISALSATKLLAIICGFKRERKHDYKENSDVDFNNAVSILVPSAFVVSAFALITLLFTTLSGEDSVFALFVAGANALFIPLGRSFISGLLEVIASSVLWFFGIHGSNVLESVMDSLFTPAIDINIALISSGQAPTEILTKQFFDVFVLMGGCGTAICLLISLLLFTKRRRNRHLSCMAAIPMLFNINEIMTFGLPVIYNSTLFIPFLLVPVVSYLTTYIAMYTGLVPLTNAYVNWTAPVILSGYMATGSFGGSILQIVNIIIGVLIYKPFIVAYDKKSEDVGKKLIEDLVNAKKHSESVLVPITLTALRNSTGSAARSVLSDLKYAISKNSLKLYYQPQYDDNRVCVGAEALLRWFHPVYGLIYPPLVIQLAEEGGILEELEEYIMRRVVSESADLRAKTGYKGEISVNVSATTIQSVAFYDLLANLSKSKAVKRDEICIEITEQTALLANEDSFSRLNRIKKLGYKLAIDDFSMGHTSLTYLQENHFDTVKLDGQLITDMAVNKRSYDIVKNISALSKQLGFSMIAEFVETEKQVEMLKAADCFVFQGYLFSKAIEPEAFEKLIMSEKSGAAKSTN